MTKNRILAITIALALTLSALTGCSSVPGMSGGSSNPNSGAQSDKSTPDNSSDSSSAPDASDAGSDKSGGDVPYYVGDSVSTAWFDFTVDSVEVMNEYEGYAAAEGKKLLVVQLSLKSTVTFSSEMYQNDFVVGWDLEDDYDYVDPLYAYCDAQFPDEYTLKINEARTGILVYEVPADFKDFWLNFLEVYDNDEYGESFFVYFTAE